MRSLSGSVRVLTDSNENEMVLAFLRAEFHSPRYKQWIRQALGHDASLLNRPRLDDAAENAARKRVLSGFRGFGANTLLFTGFPMDARWVRVEASAAEVADMKYAKHETWITLSGGSRTVRDGAANVDKIPTGEDANANIRAVVREVQRGQSYPPLIAAAMSSDDKHVLLEGHTRATAYVRALQADAPVELIVAYSPNMAMWGFY
jgi:hypothetical protein